MGKRVQVLSFSFLFFFFSFFVCGIVVCRRAGIVSGVSHIHRPMMSILRGCKSSGGCRVKADAIKS